MAENPWCVLRNHVIPFLTRQGAVSDYSDRGYTRGLCKAAVQLNIRKAATAP